MSYTGPERRYSGQIQRQAWKDIKLATLRGWARIRGILHAAGFFIYGSITGTLLYAAVTGAFTSAIVADSPIELKPGGVDTILWAGVTFLVGVLLTLVRGWLAKRDVNEKSMAAAIAELERRLDVKDAFEQGEENAKKQLNVNVNVGAGSGAHRLAKRDPPQSQEQD